VSRRRSFRGGARQVRFGRLFARVGVLLVLVAAVMLTVRCTKELGPTRGDGRLELTWKVEPGVPVAAADSARTWVLDGQGRILVGPVVAPFDAATGSFDISLRVPAGDDRAVRMQLEGAGARGRGVVAEGEARGIAVSAAGAAEALVRLHDAVPRLEPFAGQPGDLRIMLRWSSVPGASGYRLYRSPSTGPEDSEEVADTVRVFELTDMARWSPKSAGAGSAAAGLRGPAVLDTTWFRVGAQVWGGAPSVVSDSVAVSFPWVEDTPHVLSAAPTAGAIGVPDSVAVEIAFDRPMDPSSLGDVRVPSAEDPVSLRLDGTMEFVAFGADSTEWQDGGRRLRLRPAVPLRRDARYLLSVTPGLRDLDGRPLDQSRPEAGLQGFESRFGTERYNPLCVVAVAPDSGATVEAIRPVLEARLNRKARPASVNAATVLLSDSAGVGVECSVALLQDSLIRVTPLPALRFATRYVLMVTTGVRDLRGRVGEPLDQQSSTPALDPFVTAFRTPPQPSGPRVVAVTPVDGTRSVPPSQEVRVRFSRPIQAASVSRENLTVRIPSGVALSGPFRPSADFTEFVFTTAQFHAGDVDTVRVDAEGLDPQGIPIGILDANGIPFDQDSTVAGYQSFRSVFRVENCPQLISLSPAHRSRDVPVNTPVTLRFSLPMDRSSVTAANLGLSRGTTPLTLRPLEWTDSMQVTLRPAGSFSFCDTFTVFADTSLHSSHGSRFDWAPGQPGYQPLSVWFVTVADGISPRVASLTPESDAVDVPAETETTVHFTKPVNPVTVDTTSFFLQKKPLRPLPLGPPLVATCTITSDSLEATLRPAAPLENGVEYQVTVKKWVEDRCGQPLDQKPEEFGNQDLISTFHTVVERVPPSVLTVHPGLPPEEASVDATVEVTFSEPMGFEGTLTGAFSMSGPDGLVIGKTFLSPDGVSLFFTPSSPLRCASRFYVKVDTTATDRNRNLLDQEPVGGRQPFTSFFDTAPDRMPPRVLAWVPVDGASGVKVTVQPEVTFDEAMAASTLPGGLRLFRLVNSSEEPVLLRVEIQGDRHAVLIPTDRLRFAERYTLEANDAARDTSGNGLDQDRVLPGSQPDTVSFRTEDFPPRVAAVISPRDSSGVDPAVVIEVRFAASVDPATVVDPEFALYPDNSALPVPGTILSLSDTVFRYTPDAPLAPDSQYWVRISTQVADRAGNHLDQEPATASLDPFQYGFHTGTPPLASAGPGICDPSDSSRVTIDAAASLDPDGSLAGAEVDWGDGSVETIIVPNPSWPAPQHTYACTDAHGCNLLDDDGDGSTDETDAGGCDESYRIILRVRDNEGLWSADTTGVSFCNLQVLSWTPAGSPTGVDTLLAVVRLRFTRALDPSLPHPALFRLETQAGDSVTVARSWEAGSLTVLLAPTGPLLAGTTYRLRALPGIQSADGRIFDQYPGTPGLQSFEAVFETQPRPSSPPPALSPPPFSASPAQEGRARRR
jgi:hypothetical protein